MEPEFINITEANIEKGHLCCIIKKKSKHEGVENKRAWLKERIQEGQILRKLYVDDTFYIEYAPLEKAWVPIQGDNYMYIYCLWVNNAYRGKGYGKRLLNYCIEDAKKKRKSGICVLGSLRKKHWLTNPNFLKSNGFEVVDITDYGFQLLCLSFDGTKPYFPYAVKKGVIDSSKLTIYYDDQCPYIVDSLKNIVASCSQLKIDYILEKVSSCEQAKALPCVFNNFAVFYQGQLQTINIVQQSEVQKICGKRRII